MTVAAATWNVTTDQGKTWARTVTYRLNGTPFDLTGWGARLAVKRNFTSSAVIELDSDDGDFVLGGPAGTIEWSVSAVDMEALSGKYRWDLEIYSTTDPTLVYGVARGEFCVRPEVAS